MRERRLATAEHINRVQRWQRQHSVSSIVDQLLMPNTFFSLQKMKETNKYTHSLTRSPQWRGCACALCRQRWIHYKHIIMIMNFLFLFLLSHRIARYMRNFRWCCRHTTRQRQSPTHDLRSRSEFNMYICTAPSIHPPNSLSQYTRGFCFAARVLGNVRVKLNGPRLCNGATARTKQIRWIRKWTATATMCIHTFAHGFSRFVTELIAHKMRSRTTSIINYRVFGSWFFT